MRVSATMILRIAFAFIVSLAGPAARAEECAPAQLDSAELPGWDQGDSGLCYAFSAAVLIDLFRISHSPSSSIGYSSPLILGMQSVANRWKERRASFYSGWIEHSLATGFEQGTCQMGVGDRIGGLDSGQFFSVLREFRSRTRAGDSAAVTELRIWLSAVLGNRTPLPSIQELEVGLLTQFEPFVAQLLSSSCSKTTLALNAETVTKMSPRGGSDVSLVSELETQMKLGNPAAVLFCSEVVSNPRFSPGYGELCSLHYAVVVGQRMRDGRCEAQLRDSACSNHALRAGKTVCDLGHHWIDRKLLLSTAQSITWLQPTAPPL